MMVIEQFRENLFLYGANVHQWPEEIREAGLEVLRSSSEAQALLAEHEHFERVLTTRRYEEPSSNLAQRIISASLQQKQRARFSPASFISEVLSELRFPKPALSVFSVVMILVLVIGFAIGFLNPPDIGLNAQEETNLQAFLYDEGDVL